MKKIAFATLALFLILSACKSSKYTDLGDGLFADIQTDMGDIIVKLEHERAPVTVANFVSLAEGNNPFVSDQYKEKRYYDGVVFHRVIKDFMIQGGDPTATGSGNPGYRFKDELSDSLRHSKKGILSMANSGVATNGSQFFITHKATPFLDGYDENGFLKPCGNPRVSCHAVFGEVVQGIEVVDSIAGVATNERDRPLSDVVMNKVEIIRNGKEAKSFDAPKVMSDYFAEEEARVAEMKKMQADFATELTSQKEAATTLPSGLKIHSMEEGQGDQPKVGQKVLVHYAGWLADGTLFDTSKKEIAEKFGKFAEINDMHRGDFSPSPMDYSPDSRLIAGFKEGLLTMKVGDKIRLFIPPHLGYGPQGGGPIPPNADLVFDLEVVGIAGTGQD